LISGFLNVRGLGQWVIPLMEKGIMTTVIQHEKRQNRRAWKKPYTVKKGDAF